MYRKIRKKSTKLRNYRTDKNFFLDFFSKTKSKMFSDKDQTTPVKPKFPSEINAHASTHAHAHTSTPAPGNKKLPRSNAFLDNSSMISAYIPDGLSCQENFPSFENQGSSGYLTDVGNQSGLKHQTEQVQQGPGEENSLQVKKDLELELPEQENEFVREREPDPAQMSSSRSSHSTGTFINENSSTCNTDKLKQALLQVLSNHDNPMINHKSTNHQTRYKAGPSKCESQSQNSKEEELNFLNYVPNLTSTINFEPSVHVPLSVNIPPTNLNIEKEHTLPVPKLSFAKQNHQIHQNFEATKINSVFTPCNTQPAPLPPLPPPMPSLLTETLPLLQTHQKNFLNSYSTLCQTMTQNLENIKSELLNVNQQDNLPLPVNDNNLHIVQTLNDKDLKQLIAEKVARKLAVYYKFLLLDNFQYLLGDVNFGLNFGKSSTNSESCCKPLCCKCEDTLLRKNLNSKSSSSASKKRPLDQMPPLEPIHLSKSKRKKNVCDE